ncbi:hypothetical protein L209DRAFT_783176, partial [Thermothelomyces heterothallicus CBS 203.75]
DLRPFRVAHLRAPPSPSLLLLPHKQFPRCRRRSRCRTGRGGRVAGLQSRPSITSGFAGLGENHPHHPVLHLGWSEDQGKAAESPETRLLLFAYGRFDAPNPITEIIRSAAVGRGSAIPKQSHPSIYGSALGQEAGWFQAVALRRLDRQSKSELVPGRVRAQHAGASAEASSGHQGLGIAIWPLLSDGESPVIVRTSLLLS